MKKNYLILFSYFFFFSFGLFSQGQFSSEDDLKKQAANLFEEKQFIEAAPLYAQLLSLYPKDAEYNFKYGACLLSSDGDKEKPLKYLIYAITEPDVDPLAYYYLGRAYHLNYNFGKAVKQYNNYKKKASSREVGEFPVDRQIEMCKNGNQLLSKLNEVQVLERQEISLKDFFRVYDLDGIDGKIITKPEDFQSKEDKKVDEKSVIYLPNDAREVYFSSYGKKGEQGKDIFKAIKLGNGKWSEAVNLGSSINTPYDEDYAFIHPDGRTLYFASKGHSSMGGYDLFKSIFDQTTAKWGEPENLDFAFSSADDDILFVTDKDKQVAYFASNRTNEAGKVTVYKVLTERAPAEVSVIKGKFIAENSSNKGKAKITVIDKATNKTVGVYETDEKGNYTVEIGKNGGEYQFNLETTSDAPIHTGLVRIPKQDEFEVLGQELRLVNEGEDQQLVIKNIFDGSTAQQINSGSPQVSSDLLRSKANLDVNFSENQLANLERESSQSGASSASEQKTDNSKSSEEEQQNIEKKDATSTSSSTDLQNKLEKLSQSNRAMLNEQGDVVNSIFAEAIRLEQKSTEESDENNRKTEALKAAFALELGKDLEKNISESNKYLKDIKKDSADAAKLINEGELKLAEQKLKELGEFSELVTAKANSKKLVENKSDETAQEIQKMQSDLNKVNNRLNDIGEEKSEINQRIEDLESQKKKANKEETKRIDEQIEELNLDLQDFSFQADRLAKRKVELSQNADALALKESTINSINNQLSSTSPEELANYDQVSDEDKQLIEKKIIDYREEGDLAFVNAEGTEKETEVQEKAKNTEDEEDPSSQINDSEKAVSTTSKQSDSKPTNLISAQEIREQYKEQLELTQNNPDPDIKNAQKLEIYEKWTRAIDNSMGEKEVQLTQENKKSKREELQNEINELQQQKDEVADLKRGVEEEVLASMEDPSSESSEFVVLEEVVEADEPVVKEINDVSEVTDESVIPDDFTNFKFNQTYRYGNQRPSQIMAFAKRSLYEASEIDKQAEKARSEAYTLPTAEERSKAFERANQLETASEEKQLEAAEYFAEYNRREFIINQRRVLNANQFEDEFESDNLELANLLSEEAEVYFSTAAELRADIKPDERLSQKEVKLQKAYDYEMLALEKQRQALTKLSLVDDAYLKETIIENQGDDEEYFQAISDAKVLSINSAEEASKKSDSLMASIETLEQQANSYQEAAEELPVGRERDSVVALYDSVRKDIERTKTKAAVYYEREKQIKSGVRISNRKPVLAKTSVTSLYKPSINNEADLIELDTVDINDERKQLILNSNAFVEYSQLKASQDQLFNQARVDYENALALSEENNRLKKQAIIEENKAEMVTDEEERQRLIKSATVLNSKVEKNQIKLDSINTRIKVKNYLISTKDQQLSNQLADLPEAEKKEIIAMSQSSEGRQMKSQFIEESKVDEEQLVVENQLNEKETSIQEEETSEVDPEPIEEETPAQKEPNDVAEVAESEEPETADLNETVEEVEEPELDDGQEQEPEDEIAATNTERSQNNQEEVNQENDLATADEMVEEVSTEAEESQNEEEQPKGTDIGEDRESTEAKSREASIESIDEIPRIIKQAIFIELDRDQSAYSVDNPIPVNVNLPEGLVYKIQVGAFRNPIPQNLFKGFAPIMAEEIPNGITRYTAGLFLNERTAIQTRNEIREIGYPDAFVVAFLNGKHISLSQARGESGEEQLAVSESANSNRTTTEGGIESKGLSAAFDDPNVAEATSVSAIDKLYFTVQFGVFSKPLEKGLYDYDQLNVIELPNGLIRYNAGVFDNSINAAELKITIQSDFSDAFVTAYYRGKRISLNEASRLRNR